MSQAAVNRLSERVGELGGVHANFMVEAVKTSTYGRGETLLRELMQNSWDARVSDHIKFDVHEKTLDDMESWAVWDFLRSEPSTGPEAENLTFGDWFDTTIDLKIDVLIVTDRQTKGLCGVLNPATASEVRNFVRYFFEVGRDSDDAKDGGSFGVGRSVAYGISEIGTAIVYSQYKDELGRRSARLMGMALGEGFDHDEQRYTGRHWWGEVREGRVLPIQGTAALKLAQELGFEVDMDFQGTSVMVVSPRQFSEAADESSGEISESTLVDSMRDAALVFAWPHLVDETIEMTFRRNGELLPEPNPRADVHLAEFVRAYENLESTNDPQRQVVQFKKKGLASPEDLGNLAWSFNVHGGERPLRDIPSSVALMRAPRFIVKYLPVSSTVSGLKTCAVFKVAEAFEEIFRRSEPIAHDDWLPSKLNLGKGRANPVAQAVQGIPRLLDQRLAPKTQGPEGSAPAAVVGAALGALFAGIGVGGRKAPTPTMGGGAGPGPKGGGSKSRTATCTLREHPEIVATDGFGTTWRLSFQTNLDPTRAKAISVSWQTFLDLDEPGAKVAIEPDDVSTAYVLAVAGNEADSSAGEIVFIAESLGSTFEADVVVPHAYEASFVFKTELQDAE